MKNLYHWIIIIIFVIVLGFGFVTQQRYKILKQEYNELLFEKSNIIDSLEKDNLERIETIEVLETEIDVLNYKIDSLTQVKRKVEKSKSNFTISNSISEGSNLLKKNLNEKVINNSI